MDEISSRHGRRKIKQKEKTDLGGGDNTLETSTYIGEESENII
jgi:hypothetical protein